MPRFALLILLLLALPAWSAKVSIQGVHSMSESEAIDLISDSGNLSMLSVLERYSAAEREEEVRAVYDDAIEELRDAYNDAIEDLRDSRSDD